MGPLSWTFSTVTINCTHHIVGTFEGEHLVGNKNLAEKSFTNCPQTTKLVELFSSKVSHYTKSVYNFDHNYDCIKSMHAAHIWYENKIYSSNTNEDIYNPEKTRRVSVSYTVLSVHSECHKIKMVQKKALGFHYVSCLLVRPGYF